jgi:hypothetical protein
MTSMSEVKAPLYFSIGHENVTHKSQSQLETLLKEVLRKRKRDKEALYESRLANKYLIQELKKYKTVAPSSTTTTTTESTKTNINRLVLSSQIQIILYYLHFIELVV